MLDGGDGARAAAADLFDICSNWELGGPLAVRVWGKRREGRLSRVRLFFDARSEVPMPPPRILHIGPVPDSIADTVARAAGLGFDSLLFTPPPESGRDDDPANGAAQGLAEECRANGLALFADLDPYMLDLHHPLVEEHPECFALRRNGEGHVVDPRHPVPGQGQALLRRQADPEPLLAWWSAVIAGYREAGVTGFRARHPGTCGPALWRALIDAARDDAGTLTFIADTPGERREDVSALAECGFDYTLSSLPWWDGRASWFVEEHALLSTVAPVIAAVDAPEKLPPATTALRRARLAIAALTGTGLMMPDGFELPADGAEAEALAPCIRAANAAVAHDGGRDCIDPDHQPAHHYANARLGAPDDLGCHLAHPGFDLWKAAGLQAVNHCDPSMEYSQKIL